MAVAAAGLLLSPAAPAVAQPVQPGVGIRLVDAPTARRNDPRAQVAIVDHLKPGNRIHRRIEVSNGTAAPITLRLYPAAAGVKGSHFHVVEGRSSNELTTWTSVSPAVVTLPPGGSAYATVTVAVPTDVKPGERYAVVVAELPARPQRPGGIAVASRVGVRLYVSVGGGAEPFTDFRVTRLQARRTPRGAPRVTALVVNTGGRALDLSGALSLGEGPGGLAAPAHPIESGMTVGIGQEAEVGVTLDRTLPRGPWRATLRVRSGPAERVVTGTLRFPLAVGTVADAMPAGPEQPGREPALLAAGLLAGGLATALVTVTLRNRRRRWRAHPVG